MEPQAVVGRHPAAQRAVVVTVFVGRVEVVWWIPVHAAKVTDHRL
jgi:hypothetical protein